MCETLPKSPKNSELNQGEKEEDQGGRWGEEERRVRPSRIGGSLGDEPPTLVHVQRDEVASSEEDSSSGNTQTLNG